MAITAVVILLGTTVAQGWKNSVFAQAPPPHPLEGEFQDPLLPSINRPLSPLERLTIQQTIDELNTQANAQLQVGNEEGAFALWYRELRLRRELGRLEEVQGLARVGGIAWEKSRTPDVRVMIKRLITIQQQVEAEKTLDPVLLNALGQAYLQLRSIDEALVIYQRILASARQQNDILAQEATLKIIGQLHLARFHYSEAAPVYEELVTLAQAQLNTFNEGLYLQQLAEIYQQALQPENSIRIKEQLVDYYLKT
ncbi:MAG: tetratricopeptide repeat protein, partial [Microcystaceae cyanobacterium]